MPLRDDLLNPIPGDNPAGVDLRDDKIWDVIKEARRADIVADQGDYKRELKTSDWAVVVRETSNAIATRSKDLQLAVWLIEANFYREGFAGLAEATRVTAQLLVKFWDGLHPALEDGDAGYRVSMLEYFASKDRTLYNDIRLSPVTTTGVTIYRFRESEDVGIEKPDDDYDTKQARNKKIEAGKMSGEQFAEAFKATPKSFYKQRAAEIAAALDAINELDKAGNEVFGSEAPGYTEFRRPIEEVQGIIRQLLAQKLELEPDPVDVAPAVEEASPALGADAGAAPVTSAGVPGGLSAEPTSRDDATGRVVVAARWLRRAEPTSPTSYMMLRALRWGELRAQAPEPDPRLLHAPPPASRTQLRGLMLDSKWAELLEASEGVMATPAGRGWLDLQRYALKAVDELGPEYGAVASAIRSELRALLREVPTLIDMTMMDGLPTASPETRNWLRAEFSNVEPEEVSIANEPEAAPVAATSGGDSRDRTYERALGEVRAGRAQKAIELLLRELDREKSARGRFLRQSQLTRIMVESGFEAIARPILDDMLQRMETHHLEDWEAGALLAQPLAALYKCLEKTGEDSSRQQEVYLRICRLDPVQAMSFGPRS